VTLRICRCRARGCICGGSCWCRWRRLRRRSGIHPGRKPFPSWQQSRPSGAKCVDTDPRLGWATRCISGRFRKRASQELTGCGLLPWRCPALSLYQQEKKWDDAGTLPPMRRAMNRYLLTALLILVPLRDAAPQAEVGNVKVRFLRVAKAPKQKPVPFYVVALRNQANGANSAELKTDLDGKAEKQFAPGHYSIATPKPVELGGKRYSWSLEVQINGAEQRIDLTNDNAKIEDVSLIPASSGEGKPSTAATRGDLSSLFDRLKDSVVTVRSESGGRSGFLVDPAGLVVTNNHVVQSSNSLAVQLDQKRKPPARAVTSNADKDVAVLWVDPAAFREAVVAPLLPKEAAARVVAGQRVFTIRNPPVREEVLSTRAIS